MREGVLFAGGGGSALGSRRAGAEIAWTAEVEAHPRTILQARFPEAVHYRDVKELDPATLPPVEILSAGSPCQDFSIAGKRAGLGGERSGLFGEFIRIIDGMRARGLRYAIWENVPGALTSNKGQDFANVLGALVGGSEPLPLPKHPNGRRSRYAGIAHGPWGTLAWRVLDAQHFGVAQRRQRIFAVLSLDSWHALRIVFPDYSDPLPYDLPWVNRGGAWAAPVDVDGLRFDTGMEPPDPHQVRLAEVLEQDVDERFFLSQKACEGILRRATRRGKELPPLLDYALRVQAGEGPETVPVVAYGVPDLAACLTAHPGRYDGESETFIPVPYRKVKRARSDSDFETWEPATASNTLNLFDQGDVRATDVVVEPFTFRVRRLTPVECERLSGMPDGWTDPHGDASDSARYKVCGNTCVANVAEWIAGRIHEVGA